LGKFNEKSVRTLKLDMVIVFFLEKLKTEVTKEFFIEFTILTMFYKRGLNEIGF